MIGKRVRVLASAKTRAMIGARDSFVGVVSGEWDGKWCVVVDQDKISYILVGVSDSRIIPIVDCPMGQGE